MATCLRIYRVVPPGLGAAPVLGEDGTGVKYDPVVLARVVGPDHLPTALVNCQFVGISGPEYLALQAGSNNSQPIDYAVAGAMYSFALATVVGLYLVSNSVGSILGLIRRA